MRVAARQRHFFLYPLAMVAVLTGCAPALRQAPEAAQVATPTQWAYQSKDAQATPLPPNGGRHWAMRN